MLSVRSGEQNASELSDQLLDFNARTLICKTTSEEDIVAKIGQLVN